MNGQPGSGVIISSVRLAQTVSGVVLNGMSKETPTKISDRKPETFTLFFNEPNAQDEHLCGGKGSSLAILTQMANSKSEGNVIFTVPPGFTLTTDAFAHQLKHNAQIMDAISHIEHIVYNRSNASLDDACKELSKLFNESPIEENVLSQIKGALAMLTNKNDASTLKVAVRSSAIGEDGAQSSSAGQNQTFLGVRGIDDISVAIRKCWASLFTAQSITYRVQNLQPISTKMAVVIQKMIAPDCAGVLFTQHPVTKDPGKLLVTANYGLGEVRVFFQRRN